MRNNDEKYIPLAVGQRLKDSNGNIGVVEKIVQEFVFVRFPDRCHRIRRFLIGKEFFVILEPVSQPQSTVQSAPVLPQKVQIPSAPPKLIEQRATAVSSIIRDDALNKLRKDGYEKSDYDSDRFNQEIYDQADHSKSIEGKVQGDQALSQEDKGLIVHESSTPHTLKRTDGHIVIGTTLYSKKGVPLTVFELHDKNREPWFIALAPVINGAREASKYYFSQVGRDIFLEKADASLSTTELRKKSSYSLYFQAWDKSNLKIKFSSQPIPTDSQFEQLHFEKIELFLQQTLQDLIVKYGGEYANKYYAEYFGKRGMTTYLAEKKHIEKQVDEPYFGRVDCENENGIYIGKSKIEDRVIEWTDERAALYYEYQQYVADASKGLSLVRSYQIQNQIYKGYTDLYANAGLGDQDNITASQGLAVTTDPHLMKILEMDRELKQVHDIIRTIQSNQYQIIASSPRNNALILGCAGSGKTMILYHRIRYILRNNRDIQPEQMYILSPTEALIRESDSLAETLHLDKVKRLSTATLYINLIQQYSERYAVALPEGTINIALNSKTSDIYSHQFLSSLKKSISELYSMGSSTHQHFLEWQDEKLKQENDDLLKKFKLHVISDCDSINSAVKYLEDKGFSSAFVQSCKDTKSLLETASQEAAQEKLYYGIDSEIQKKQQELFEKENSLQLCQTEIDAKIKSIKEKKLKQKDWEKERSNFQETLTLGELTNKTNKNRKVNFIQNDADYGREIDEITKQLKKEEQKLDGLKWKRQNEKRRIEILSEEVEQLQSSAPQRKEVLKQLLSQQLFAGTEQHDDFNQLYKFYAQFENSFPGGYKWGTNDKIENPIEYILSLGEVYAQMKRNCDIQNRSGNPDFQKAFTYALQEAAESNSIALDPDFTAIPFLLLYGLNCRYDALKTDEVFFFVDEFQDYNGEEMELLARIYPNAIFNFYGDLRQCINQKGLGDIQQFPPCMANIQKYQISENYRNALEITEYANQAFGMNMLPIGLHGTVSRITTFSLQKEITFPQSGDRVAIIYKEMDDLYREGVTPENAKFHFLNETNSEIATEQINVLPISLAKGLEFERVYVIMDGMSENEKYVAATRALNELVLISSDS